MDRWRFHFLARDVLIALALLLVALPAPGRCETPRYCLSTGVDTTGDNPYILLQEAGIFRVGYEHDVRTMTLTPANVDRHYATMLALVEAGCEVVFAGGTYQSVEPLDTLAREHPDVRFVLLDSVAKEQLPNITSFVFKQNEASFVAGVAAAYATSTNKIGFLGGVDAPIINDFLAGFRAGLHSMDPDIDLLVRYIGDARADFNPFGEPELGHAAAKELYAQGVDIVFGVAGDSTRGVFRAAKEAGRFAIGVDADQDAMSPGHILTSVIKRLDNVIPMAVALHEAGQLKPRIYSVGLAEEAVSISPMTYTRFLFNDLELRDIRAKAFDITTGAISVPTTYAK
jgi:basic membrane protein A